MGGLTARGTLSEACAGVCSAADAPRRFRDRCARQNGRAVTDDTGSVGDARADKPSPPVIGNLVRRGCQKTKLGLKNSTLAIATIGHTYA